MEIIDLEIVLENTGPSVTRALKVPVNIRLDRLHLTIQAAMGWENYHLYEFRVEENRWGISELGFDDDILPANKSTLWDVLENFDVKTILYTYDFGDSWEHLIKPGALGEAVAGESYPQLTDVTGTCPPEDVGGIYGYEEFLEAMADPDHPEHDELKMWYGGSFDPNRPDIDELKLDVLKLAL